MIAHAQTAGGSPGALNCNNQARSVAITAGWHNVLYGPCTAVTISVGPVTVQTPSECPMGGAYYDGTIYTCGPQSTGNHCIAQGYKVNLSTYDTGGVSNCPPLPTTTSFESWDAAKGIIEAWLSCPPLPLLSKTYDWSAKIKKCPGVSESGSVPVEYVTLDHDAYFVWHEDPAASLPMPTTNPFDPLGPGPIVDPATVPAPVREARESLAGLLAVHVAAEYQVDYRDPAGVLTDTDVYSIAGTVAADGRFRLDVTVAGLGPGGEAEPIQDQCSFDGASFSWAAKDGENSNVWTSTSARRDGMLRLLAPFAAPLVEWVGDPTLLPALPSGSYTITEDSAAQSLEIEREHVSFGQLFATTRHDVDVAGPVPTISTAEVLAADGSTIRTRQFADYCSVGAANRPRQVIDTWYEPGSAHGMVTATLRIGRVVPLHAEDLQPFPVVEPAGSVWMVRD
jgi:hypothetical protein